MTQPIQNTLIQGQKTAVQEVFKMPGLLSIIFKVTQEQNNSLINNSLINKAAYRGSQILTNSSWQEIRRAATTNHPAGPTAFQKKHPTLSSFIQSNQIANHQQLVAHLRKEAQDLGLTQTEAFQRFRTSTASKYILSLDALIEQTNFERISDQRFLLGPAELPEIRNYETWNEKVQTINVSEIIALHLNHKNLTRIPFGVFQLKNLQNLNLRKNQLLALPKQIGLLQNLEWLSLDRNQLISLPQEIGELENLQRLTLENNECNTLPAQIVELSNLNCLWIDNNQLAALPESFARLIPQLETGSNEIERLVEAGRKAGTLEKKS